MSGSGPSFGPHGLAKVSSDTRDLLIDALSDDRGVHLETAIAGIAAVAGTLVLRSTGLPLNGLPVGSPVFADAVNEIGPQYVAILGAMCEATNIDPKSGWTDPVPEKRQPQRSVPELTRLLEGRFSELCERLAVPVESRARVALFTAVRIMGEGMEMLSPEVGKAIVMTNFVAGAKTVPESRGQQENKPFWKKLFGS